MTSHSFQIQQCKADCRIIAVSDMNTNFMYAQSLVSVLTDVSSTKIIVVS
jgi:hypothetical protein